MELNQMYQMTNWDLDLNYNLLKQQMSLTFVEDENVHIDIL